MESEEGTIDTTLSNKSGAASTATSELHAPRAVIRRTCMRRTTRSTRTKTRDEGRRDEECFFEGCAAAPLEAVGSNVARGNASSFAARPPVGTGGWNLRTRRQPRQLPKPRSLLQLSSPCLCNGCVSHAGLREQEVCDWELSTLWSHGFARPDPRQPRP